MNIGIYSDVHVSYTSSIMPLSCPGSKYTRRLQMIIDSFKYMYDVFEKNNVELIFNNGDLFDSHTIRSEELTAVAEAYSYSKGVKEYHIIGNHDTLDNSRNFYSTSILDSSGFISVINEPTVLEDGISLLPYMKPEFVTIDLLNSLSSKSNILMSHIDILGSHLRPDYTMDSGVDPELLANYFDVVFNGHLHTHEVINTSRSRVMNLGSFSSNSFSDSNSYRPGFWIYNTETKIGKRYENPNAILFRKYSVSSIESLIELLNKRVRRNAKYIMRITVPYSLRSDARDVIQSYENIVAFKIVADIKSSMINPNSDISKRINSENDITEEFLKFLDDNPNLMKYPRKYYDEYIKKIREIV